MTNVIYEIMKEFKISVDNLDFEIQGRLLKRISGESEFNVDYKWEISHYYRPTDGATVYYPSQNYAATLKKAEQLLLKYMTPFTNIDVEINHNY